jgi:hypothetical protein
MRRWLTGIGLAVVIAAVALPATFAGARSCNDPLPQGSETVTLDPAEFVPQIDNHYWPMAPGTRWVSREFDFEGSQRVTVTVLERTRDIEGIEATVVHDVVSERGELVENTFDWYAQDVCGNVWYLGENTKEYENGEVVSTARS